MDIIKSIQVRMQNYTNAHFEKSKYGRRIAELRDKHKGQRCFICGNGPSLAAQDLTRLDELHEVTFATNRVYKIFPQTKWRPTYYVSEDPIIIRNIQKEINEIECDYKFIPAYLNWYENVDIKDAYYFKMNYKDANKVPYRFSENAAKELVGNGTVTITCIQLAVYMGFKEIYLIGVDHNFNKVIDENGKVVVDNSVKNYFCEGYDEDVKDEVEHNLGKTTKSYMNARAYCDKNGIKIYNATRGGKLEVFERASLDELIF